MFRTAAIVGLIILLAGCSPEPEESSTMRIGVLPDQTEERLQAQYRPLIDYLAEKMNKPIELIVPIDYQHLLALFADGDIDIAFFGGLTFLQAQARSGAVPLVSRDIDTRFTSLFIAGRNASGTSISEFGGKKFAFGSKLSTSGHLMPRYFMKSQGIAPDEFFSSVTYTSAHDQTALAVADGSFDIGVASAVVIRQMIATGELDEDEVDIIGETAPFINYVWAVQPSMTPATIEKLQDAFLILSMADENHRFILNSFGAKSFLPVHQGDFEGLRDVARELDLL